jgi:hypothetical protein
VRNSHAVKSRNVLTHQALSKTGSYNGCSIALIRGPIAARFWSKVSVRDDKSACWLWTASVVGRGKVQHGQFTYRLGPKQPQVHVYAHRVAWQLTYGAIPKGLCVCHRCDVPRCCNPAHLFLGTQADNLNDARAKGRMPRRALSIPRPGLGSRTRALTYAQRLGMFLMPYRRGLVVDLARKHGVTKATISQIRSGRFAGAPTWFERVPFRHLQIRGEVA